MPWRPLDVTEDEIKVAVRSFSKKCRFLVDENMDAETTLFLRGEGWNVKSVFEAGLSGHPDENVLALAHREDRVLLTHDADYLDSDRFPLHRNPGIVLLPGAQGDVYTLVRSLMDLMSIFAPYREFVRGARIVFRRQQTMTPCWNEPAVRRWF